MGVTQLKIKFTVFMYSIYAFPYFDFNFEYVGFYINWIIVIRTVLVPEALRVIFVSNMLAFGLLLTVTVVVRHLSYPLPSGD